MLKDIIIDTKPNGMPITIPASINETNFEQQVKRFIELTAYNTFDGQMHISVFRTYHGGQWTIKILDAIVQELKPLVSRLRSLKIGLHSYHSLFIKSNATKI